jgi:DNA polymerase-1
LYLTPTENHWIIDGETDGLRDQATQVFVVCVENSVTDEEHTFYTKEEFNAWKPTNAIWVGHNVIGFDGPVLNRFWGTSIGISKIVDTFVLSMLYNPSFAGGHSLEAWGVRLKYPKKDFNDFSQLTDKMVEYCKNDVKLTKKLFLKLTERMRSVGFTELGAEIEHLAWNIIQNKQKQHGFPFDFERANKLYVQLRGREEELKKEIYEYWPPELRVVGEYKKSRKANGEFTALYLRHLEQFPKVSECGDDGSYRVFDWVEFNLGSPPQRIAKLTEAGWKPVSFTKKGNPKVDEESLLKFAETAAEDVPAKALAKWIVTNSRANMIRTWLNAYNEKTGCIHGNLWIASTLRYRHDNPNSANAPAVRMDKDENVLHGETGSWSYEARDLWTCGDPSVYSLVGVDGTGIQNRCLVHSLIETVGEERVREFKELALEGDIHKRNIEILGLANKAAAKKFYYTLMMGGQGPRLAADQAQFGTEMSAKQGTALREMMIASIPGFHQLIAKLENELRKRGRITLCDGTPIVVSSPHMVIPYKLQGDESRLMKMAMILLDRRIRKEKLDAQKVGDIHDEWQFVVRTSDVERFQKNALAVFPRAGEVFDYRVVIEGAVKVGKTWAETH